MVQWPDTTNSKIKIVMQYGGTPPRAGFSEIKKEVRIPP
jgi:hypothetical protein